MGYYHPELLYAIELLYAAATDPEHWPSALESIASLAGSSSTVLSVHNIARQATEFNLSAGITPEAHRVYEAYYHRLNPWFNAAPSLSNGIVPGEACISYEELQRTEFFHDFGKPHGVVHSTAAIMAADDGVVDYLSLNRGDEREPFRAEEMEPVALVLPHLKRALEISRQLGFATHWQKAWDRAGVAMFLIRGGEVEGLNEEARRLVLQDEGLTVVSNRLRVRSRALQPAFLGLMEAAGLGRVGGPIRIPRRSGKQAFVLSSYPLPEHRLMRAEPTVLLIVSDPERGLDSMQPGLQAAFGLTPAEAKLALALMKTGGLSKAAEGLAISRHTAKAQLDAIFRKTETSSQAELVRVLLASFPLR